MVESQKAGLFGILRAIYSVRETGASTLRPYNPRINILGVTQKVNRIMSTVVKRGNSGFDMLPVEVGIYYGVTQKTYESSIAIVNYEYHTF